MLFITGRLTWIVGLLRNAIGVHLDREARLVRVVHLGTRTFAVRPLPGALPPLPAKIWVLLFDRVTRLAQRFEALFQRWQAGTLPRHRLHAARTPPQSPAHSPTQSLAQPGPAAPPRPPRLPRAFGWVNRRIPESAPPTGYLQALLHEREAELREFLADAPQAGRLLRPLCHALGLRPPAWLALPPPPRSPRARSSRPPRPPALTDPSLRLPRYVIATARAWKKTGG